MPANTHPTENLRLELARKITRFMGARQKVATQAPGLTLVRRPVPAGPACGSYEPSLALIAQGAKRVTLGKRSFIYDESNYLLTSIDLPIVSQLIDASEERPFLAVVIKLEIPIVRDLLSRADIDVADEPADSPGMVTGQITAELLGAAIRLVDLLDDPDDIPVLNPLIQREIIYRVLRGPEGARLRGIATIGDHSNRTAKAVTWIRENYAQPLRVEDLARLAGMGVSTFHRYFRDLTEMSPLQYQKQLRLQAARDHMLLDGLDAAGAAFEVGYESASQFSREYSRLFGAPPAQDVQAARLAP